MISEGRLLWQPDADRIARAQISGFAARLADEYGVATRTYDELWQWSVTELDAFWSAFARWFGVRWHTPPSGTLTSATMPGTRWFPGATLNYAEHALFPTCGVEEDATAVLFAREDGKTAELTWGELRAQVASVRAALAALGVGRGDRVAAFLPNAPEAIVAMLATASLGAIWSSCSPDFGARAVADRFTQIEPVVLFTVDGYHYGGRSFDVRETVAALRAEMPTVRAAVQVAYLDPDATDDDMLSWSDLVTSRSELAFEPMPFDAPLWILYSSGTTGLPKPIVHGHGGMLLEHAKQLALHVDLAREDRFFWFTTTGWMMWNLLVSGLVVGSAVVLYDGSPAHPDLDALWQLAERTGITCFGTSAPYLQACMKAEIRPGSSFHLNALRTVGSTGAPLPPEGFAWVYDEIGADVALASMSGGTDVCTAFVGGVPTLPVHAGEIQCRQLGCAVAAFDPAGAPLVDEVGELVVTQPMPSMPVAFWNDPDGARLRESYFDMYPGVWRHGDWITITERGTCIVYGRSDSTLNRGGVRMGTAEFYRVVDEIPGVADSLVIDTSAVGVQGELLLFVQLADRADLDDVTGQLRTRIRMQLSPRHLPDRVFAVPEVPRTVNGKKCEVPVKRVLAGVPLEQAVSLGALRNPAAMDPFIALGQQQEGHHGHA